AQPLTDRGGAVPEAVLVKRLVELDAEDVDLLHAAAARAAATASSSARLLSAESACPRTQCQRTAAWRAISVSSARTRSWFLTGSPPAVRHPRRFQPWIHFVIESSRSRESVTTQTRLPAGRERRPSSAAVYSMRLFVVCGS